MTSSGSVFSETLQEITKTKLEELSKRRTNFETSKTTLLDSIKKEENAIDRLRRLSAGVKSCFAIKVDQKGNIIKNHTAFPQLEIELRNLDRFLSQAKYDPSISAKALDAWEQSLLRHLDTQSLSFQYASLYGQLVTEWLSKSNSDSEPSSDDVQMGEAFEDLGSAQRLEARANWEKTVFEPANVDQAALWKYLSGLFRIGDDKTQATQKSMWDLRNDVYAFEARLSKPNQFSTKSLKWVIRGLWSSDLLSDEKREVLKDFESNEILLSEIADVLNMRINSLGSWSWNAEQSVPLEIRQKINGVYNIYMHEDLLQAIFLQYLGIKWSVFFKKAFDKFRKSEGGWTSPRKDIPKLDKQRLGYYLGPLERSPCLHSVRSKIHRKKYFMAQLRDSEEQEEENLEGEEEADYRQADNSRSKRSAQMPQQMMQQQQATAYGAPKRRQLASKAARKSAPSTGGVPQPEVYDDGEEEYDDDYEDDEDDGSRNPMALKQNILHLLSTELTINKHLYGEMSAFHSVFESWNPRLPHATIYTVLQFLGVSREWLQFFVEFLQAPLRFIEDDKSTPPRRRRRGTPASHVLSDVFGEIILFCLDFAVNQATSGDVLWRIHDDMWFWSRDHSVAVKAWKTVEEFNSMAGTEINMTKTGTVRVSQNQDKVLAVDKSLPTGEIRWGFLRLSPETGEFEIDQSMVDSHIEQLQKQLGNKNDSVLGFIQAWNSFAGTFFTSNFGKAANCFSRKHVDNMLSTHERIQRQIFATSAESGEDGVSSVAEHLKNALSRRFEITNVPDGYLYFPTELGGLNLQSPFISLLQIRNEVIESPAELLENFKKAERKAYDNACAAFMAGRVTPMRYALDFPNWAPESARDREVFMSFDEYVRYREYFKFDHFNAESRLTDVFRQLMRRPEEKSVDPDNTKVSVALSQLRGHANLKGITGNWNLMDPYWRWVSMMYGPEILDRFGSLSIVDSGLLPMGMVSFFKDKRVKWQG